MVESKAKTPPTPIIKRTTKASDWLISDKKDADGGDWIFRGLESSPRKII